MSTRSVERTLREDIVSTCTPVSGTPQTGIIDWMLTQITADGPVYLLAHFDDGIVWGRRMETSVAWVTSYASFPEISPEPRDITLHQARAFYADGELFVWRDGEGTLHAVKTTDDRVKEGQTGTVYIDEAQILWGDTPENEKNGFQLWREGSQGLYHALPIKAYWLPQQKQTAPDVPPVVLPPLLMLRHYLADDKTARIERSRIIGFHIPNSEEAYWFEDESDEVEDDGETE